MQTKQASEQLAEKGRKLCDALLKKHALKNDAALARHYKFPPPFISKIRHGRLEIGAEFIVRTLRLNPEWTLSDVESLYQ